VTYINVEANAGYYFALLNGSYISGIGIQICYRFLYNLLKNRSRVKNEFNEKPIISKPGMERV